jgi:hypothetical protein
VTLKAPQRRTRLAELTEHAPLADSMLTSVRAGRQLGMARNRLKVESELAGNLLAAKRRQVTVNMCELQYIWKT